MDYENFGSDSARNDRGDADLIQGQQAVRANAASAGRNAVVLTAGPDNVLILPAGADLDDIRVEGRDLVIEANGVTYIVPDGAIIVPQIVVEGVAIPPMNLAALLNGDEPQPAAGDPQSSGGNFAAAVDPLQAAYDLGNLLPYTELGFPEPEAEEVIPYLVNDDPDVIIVTPDQPAGTDDATANVDEAGLPARGGEPAGTEAAGGSETTTGTIRFNAADGVGSISLNGVAIAQVGQTFTTPNGTLTITSIAPGVIGYSYTLADNMLGTDMVDRFTVTVTDSDGDTATAMLDISVIDDAPIARADTDFVAAGTYGPETGNAMTGTGTTSGSAGADSEGADGATLSSVQNADGLVVSADGTMVIAGEYGTLTIAPDGSYSYTRAPGTPGGVSDSFTYTLTDGDGSTSSATLTIEIGDAPVEIVNVPDMGAGTIVDEAGLPVRGGEAPGSEAPTEVESTSGTITFNAPDGVATVTIGGVVITGPGQVITVPEGTLVIIGYDPVGGTIDYEFTLGDNTSGDDATVEFEVVVTDIDGDSDSETLVIEILDDVPEAVDDSATQSGENAPVTVDVFANDIEGADSVQLDAIAAVEGSLSGDGTLAYNGDGTFTYTPAPGETGSVTFDYTITDGDGDSSTATVTIDLLADSVPTIAAEGDTVVDEAGLPARGGEPAGSDAASDSETASGTIAIATGGDALGSVVIDGIDVTNGGTVATASGVLTVSVTNGQYSYSYTLADNTLADQGSDSFSLTVTDSDGDIASTTLVIAIVDDAPVAADDAAGLGAGQYGPVTGSVTANDVSGADGFAVTSYSGAGGSGAAGTMVQGQYGTLTIAADGSFSYARNPGTPGGVSDSFTYSVTDGDGDVASAQLVISIADAPVTLDVPVAGEAGTEVDEAGLPDGSDAASNGEFTSGTLSFTAPDGPASISIGGTIITAVGQTVTGSFGTLTVTAIANGQIGYTYELTTNTNGDTTQDSFAVTITDQDGDSQAGSLVIDIVDDVPTANDDSAGQAGENQAITIDALDNDVFGADGVDTSDVADVIVATQPTQGTVTYDPATGLFTYTPDAGAGSTGTTDSFTYTIVDGDGDSSTATVTITLKADSTPTIEVRGDTVVDEAGLPARGGEPAGSDAASDSETASGTIAIATGGDALGSVVIDGVDVTNGGTVATASGVLTVSVTNGQYSYSYTLADNTLADQGSDSFSLTVTDSDGDIASTTLVIAIIDDAPVAADDAAGLGAGQYGPVTGSVTANDVSGADGFAVTSYSGAGGTGAAGTMVQGQYGTLTIAADGSFSYARDPGTPGGVSDSFTYSVTDGDGDVASAQLVISIADAPVTLDVPVAGEAGTEVDEAGLPDGSDAASNGEFTSGTLSFTAPDGPASISIGGTIITAVGQTVTGSFGTLTVTAIANGQIGYTYELTTNTNGDTTQDSFAVTISDQDGDSQAGSLVIDIVDDVPTANDDSAGQAGENQAITIDALGNDVFGADGVDTSDVADVIVATQPTQGTVTYDPATGLFTYTPDAGAGSTGTTDSFTYTIVDGDGDSSTATVTITLKADSTPTIEVRGDTVVDEAGLPARGGEPAGSDAASDSETASGTIAIATGGDALGSVVIDGVDVTNGGTVASASGVLTVSVTNGQYSYSYTLADNTLADQGSDSFSLTVTDSDGDIASTTLVIAIVDDAPVAADDAAGLGAGQYGPVTGSVTANDVSGADGFAVTSYSGAGGSGAAGTMVQGQYGTLTIAADGSFSYARDPGTPGGVSDSFTYSVTDGDGDVASAQLVISIADAPVTLDVPVAGEAGTEVDEAGLPDGSDAASNGEFTSGTLSFTAPDGPASISIGGTIITAVGQTVTGSFGTLTVTAIANGQIGYTYELTTNTNGDTTQDSFAVTITDQDGDSQAGSLVIDIVDDVPTANDDSAGQAGENQAITIDALDNDVFGADGVDTSDVTDVIVATQPTQGTVTYDPATGLFTYTPDAGAGSTGTTDSFTYTIVDGDGDSSTATVTITLKADSTPTIEVRGDTVVDEAGLPARGGEPAGSDAASDSETASGTIAITTGGDALGSVVINGVDVTNGGTVTSAAGVLTVSVTNGQYSYSYTLADNTLADQGSDSFSLTVTDSDGDIASTTLVIAIVDDAPVAADDAAGLGAGQYGPVTGSVTANDVSGADGFAVTSYSGAGGTGAAGTMVQGQYGTLTIAADGSFSYARDPGTPGGVSDSFTYSVTDGDGDVASAQLVISIVDAPVTLDVPVAGEAGTEVDEAGLPDGSDAASNGEFTSGTLSFTAPDGPASISIGGTIITAVGQTVTGSFGTLTVTAIANGQIGYTYELTTNTNGDTTQDSFAVTISDQDGDSQAGSLVIDIVDDVPTANDDSAGQAGENQAITVDALGNDVFGADGVDTSDVADVIVATQPTQGTVTYDPATGLFTYTPDAGAGSTGTTDSFTYTIVDGDGDSSTATVTITLKADSVPQVDRVTALSDDDGLAGGNPASTINDIDANQGEVPTTASEATYNGRISVDFGNDSGTVSFANLDGMTGTVGTETVSYSWVAATATLTATGPRGDLFTIELAPDGSYTLTQLDNVLHAPGNAELSAPPVVLNYVATDSDGDSNSSGTLAITFNDDAPTAYADSNIVGEGSAVNGNVLTDGTDDVFGADGAAATSPAGGVTGFAAGSDTSVEATGAPGSTIETALGFLTLNADGSYTYEAKPNAISADATDVFTYTITDADGDISTQTLTINVKNVAGTVSDNEVTVDESGLGGIGSQIVPNGEFDTDGQITASGGMPPYSYTLNDPADGAYGTLTLNPDGSYTYVLDTPFTDMTGNDGRNVVNAAEAFDYTVTDSLGNVIGTGTISVDIVDDVPTARDESALSIAEDAAGPGTLSGNLLTNDIEGADGASVTSVTIGGTSHAVAIVGTTTVSTANGTYTFQADGAWTFDPAAGLDQSAGPVDASFGYTITDGDGDQDSATQPITIIDGAGPVAGPPITLIVDDENLADGSNPAVPVEDSGTITFTPGSDAITSIVFGMDLSNLDGGLTWTRVDDTTIEGHDGGNLVVTLTLDVTGPNATVTATLSDNYDSHPVADVDDLVDLGSVGVVARDRDGDTAEGTVNVSVSDDLPIVTGTVSAADSLTVDETDLGTSDSADFGGLFAPDYNADGPAASDAIMYQLGVSATGADSGLDDVATGENVLLRVNASGEVEGYTANTGLVVFTVSIDDSGTATLTQLRAVEHPDANNPDDPVRLDSADLITLTATITDGDGDTDSATVNVGNALTFRDDGPAIDAAVVDGDAILLTTFDAQTIGTDFDTATSTADFGGAFTVASSDFGADGAGDVDWAYGLVLKVIEGAPSGFSSDGDPIYLYKAADGTVIGSTSASESGITAANKVFDIAIDADGAVTVNQYAEIDHSDPDAANYDSDLAVLPTGLVAVTGTATITDRDGDSASETLELDLGGNIRFADDGPSASPKGAVPVLNVDESNFSIDASADFSNVFSTSYGADGAGSIVYSLILSGAGAASGLTDTLTGNGVFLFLENGVVVAREGVDAADAAGGDEVFRVTVDGSGKVTLDQSRAVVHADASDPDDLLSGLASDNLISLNVLVTDGDGDTATSSIAIGGDLSFNDDGPAATDDVDSVVEDAQIVADGNVLTGTGGTDANTTDGNADSAGNDGGRVAGVAQGDTDAALVSDGTVASTIGGAFGAVVIRADGSYVYTLDNANGAVQALGAGESLTDTFTYTLIDGDGDTTTATLTITINGTNDAPVVGASAATVSDEGLPYGNPDGTGTPSDTSNATTASGTVTVTDVDANDSQSITLGTPAQTLSSGGEPVVWSLSGDGKTLTGYTADIGDPVITVTIDDAGAYTVRQFQQIDHPNTTVEDVISFVVPVKSSDGTITTTRADGITVTIEDDSPTAISPADIVSGLENSGGNSATRDLDIDGSVIDNLGGDQPGTVTFNHVDGEDSGLDYGGQNVLIFVSDDGQTIEGRAGGEAGKLVFTVDLDQANGEYTFNLIEPVDNGSGTTFSDLSGGAAGNPPLKLIDSSTVTDTELLFTPINAGSVNSDSDDVAVDGQFIDITNPDAGLRIDFGDFTYNANGGGSSDDTFTINDHETVNAFRFTIDQISSGTTADVRIKAYDADTDSIVTGDAGDVQDVVTKVVIRDTSDNIVGTYVRTADGNPATVDGNVANLITWEADGSVLISNLVAQYSVETYTADGYNRIEVTNAGGGGTDGKFSLSELAIGISEQGNPVRTSFDLKLTDADGDSVVLPDAIDVTIDPVGTSASTMASTMMDSFSVTSIDGALGSFGAEPIMSANLATSGGRFAPRAGEFSLQAAAVAGVILASSTRAGSPGEAVEFSADIASPSLAAVRDLVSDPMPRIEHADARDFFVPGQVTRGRPDDAAEAGRQAQSNEEWLQTAEPVEHVEGGLAFVTDAAADNSALYQPALAGLTGGDAMQSMDALLIMAAAHRPEAQQAQQAVLDLPQVREAIEDALAGGAVDQLIEQLAGSDMETHFADKPLFDSSSPGSEILLADVSTTADAMFFGGGMADPMDDASVLAAAQV